MSLAAVALVQAVMFGAATSATTCTFELVQIEVPGPQTPGPADWNCSLTPTATFTLVGGMGGRDRAKPAPVAIPTFLCEHCHLFKTAY